MKTLEQDKLDQLLEMIQKKPGQRIVHFSFQSHPLSKALSTLCKKNQSQYHLHCTQKVFYDEALSLYEGESHVFLKHFNLRRPRYTMQGIEYDYLFATLDFNEEDKKTFLEKCYPIIRTGGYIMLLIPNSAYKDRDEWREILEEQYYVSTNIIDDLFEEYDVIVSKRMHGWGN